MCKCPSDLSTCFISTSDDSNKLAIKVPFTDHTKLAVGYFYLKPFSKRREPVEGKLFQYDLCLWIEVPENRKLRIISLIISFSFYCRFDKKIKFRPAIVDKNEISALADQSVN